MSYYNESQPVSLTAPAETLPSMLPARQYLGSATRDAAYYSEQPPAASQWWWILRRHLWTMIAFIAAASLTTLIVSARMQPLYEATATIDVDRQSPPGIVGEEASRVASLNDADQFLATQIKLIQSDSVVRPVAQAYGLRASHANGRDREDGRAASAPVVLRSLRVARAPNTYLLLVSFRDPNPELAANVANAVARSYLEHTY